MMTPLLFNLNSKRVLVVGGGKVATRRIITLFANGAQVVCVSPEFSNGLIKTQDEGLTLVQGSYDCKQLEGIDLVVAATNSEAINAQVRKDCQRFGIWCNRVDSPDDSDFIFPSVVRRGDLTLSVCTEGASPFLAKAIVKDLSQRYDESYIERTALLRECRKRILAKGDNTQRLKDLTDCSIEELKEQLKKY
ncbi:MAG: precorrin-2 dehydrogenase/sirohydrochlorin ferrochelatase family protein [Acetobacterium sp.]